MSAKVLIVSANKDNSSLMFGWFTRHGLYVALESDVARAEVVAKSGQPDAIILDDSGGTSIVSTQVAALRKLPETEQSVIFVLGTFTETQEVELLKHGADDVLSKPIRGAAMFYRLINAMRYKKCIKTSIYP